MSFPATTPTSQPDASSLLVQNALDKGLGNTSSFDRLTNLEQVVGNLLTDQPKGQRVNAVATLTYTVNANVTPNAANGPDFVLSVTDNSNFTIANPTNASSGQQLRIRIKNSIGSSGSIGTVSFGSAFKNGTMTMPADTKNRTYAWTYDGTNWIFQFITASDVSN